MKSKTELAQEYSYDLYQNDNVAHREDVEGAFIEGYGAGLTKGKSELKDVWNLAVESCACIFDHCGSYDRQQTFQGGADEEVSFTNRVGDIIAENIRKLLKP